MTGPPGTQTTRLQGLTRHPGLALLGREARARARLLRPASKEMVLRTARAAWNETAADPPRVIGLEDRAWHRGQRQDALICDLERRQPFDLLPDRTPAMLRPRCAAIPQIEIVTRDRNGGYGWAVTQALPDAIQVVLSAGIFWKSRGAAYRAAEPTAMREICNAPGGGTIGPAVLTAARRCQDEGGDARPADTRDCPTDLRGRLPSQADRRADRAASRICTPVPAR